jgi:MSHA pilin protein MshD
LRTVPERIELDRETRSNRSGVTLVEMTLAIVIISVALTGTLLVMNQTTRHSADPMIFEQAGSIAEAYLEEILLKSFADPNGVVCPSPEASRDLYDNVCDYDGLNDSGAEDQDGNAISGLEDYQVQVTVDTSVTINALTGSANVVRVDVQVSNGSLVDLTLSGYRTEY